MLKKILKIGDIEIPTCIVQGGMAVRISMSDLASEVSNCKGLGTLAGTGAGILYEDVYTNYYNAHRRGLLDEIKMTKKKTKEPFAVNLMVALKDYDNLAKIVAEENVPIFITGAGIPLKIPEIFEKSDTKLVPIISSGKAASLILKTWNKNYGRLPDAFVVEGPKAGGHLGFKYEDIIQGNVPVLEQIILDVKKVKTEYEKLHGKKIPIIAAGGIYNGKDIHYFLNNYSDGVQMGTRFVCTKEAEVHNNFKQTYINADEKDIVIIRSPLGLPGRVIKNGFVEHLFNEGSGSKKCIQQCFKNCKIESVDYCIADALINAYHGNMDKGIVFCGANAYQCKDIFYVKDLMKKIMNEIKYLV